jgi:hypothetical protein
MFVNITLARKGLAGPNTLAYFALSSATKKFFNALKLFNFIVVSLQISEYLSIGSHYSLA